MMRWLCEYVEYGMGCVLHTKKQRDDAEARHHESVERTATYMFQEGLYVGTRDMFNGLLVFMTPKQQRLARQFMNEYLERTSNDRQK